ncbi:uncharacterized protein YoxC [Mycoplasmoides fastidiosum]|uniref:Uncharacterized protein YoxC n=1 Tax=Mycoplasmoides fastidiosum TaxID=92758 RepID=A0ABU0M037_9BACT|nr:hypothetical protein [Mycoplasmoides fastidiosum]MDQ0514315.1 uncharacterized protein YoxC [Mycoplasmoides fastidiosum]UUD38081.1 hypothetical protein NPA10_01660 [Mycoplasmoides fastidiosum]
MPLWMQILLGILIVISIITVISIFLTFRRMGNVTKKIDYVVEDLTYKTESLSTTIDAIKVFSKYISLIQSLTDDQNPEKSEYVKQNRKKIMALSKYLSKIAEDKE